MQPFAFRGYSVPGTALRLQTAYATVLSSDFDCVSSIAKNRRDSSFPERNIPGANWQA